MTELLSLPIRAPRLTVAVILAVTAVLAFFARSITVDGSLENLLPGNDPERVYYSEISKAFGSEQATLVGVFAPDVFAPGTLAVIDTLSTQLAAIDAVQEVISLTTVNGVEIDETGVRVGKLMRALPESAEEAAAFRAKVLASPLYVGTIAAADGTATGVLVLFQPLSDAEFQRRHIEQRIRAVVAGISGPAEFAITGIQTLKLTGARLMEQDLWRFIPLSVLLVVGILVWAFRTVRGVLLLLATVLIAALWTLGVMVLTGRAINMGTLVLPPLLMAIGITYAIRIVGRSYQELQSGRPRAVVVGATLDDVRVPIVVATLTTLVAFTTLMFSPIHAIRDFGIYSVVGILSIFSVSLTFIPAMLVLLPEPSRAGRPAERDRWMTRLLERVVSGAAEWRRTVLWVTAGICLVSLWGATRIRV